MLRACLIMLANLQRYHRPSTLSEAITALKQTPDTTAVLAGGTHLIETGSDSITDLVDITHLGLDFIRRDASQICIGATTSLQQIIDSSVIQQVADGILATACRMTTVSRMRRNVSTIGGEVVAAAPSSGVTVALLALGARLCVVGDFEQTVSLDTFYEEAPQPLRGAIITEVVIPSPPPQTRAAFLSLGAIASSLPIIHVGAMVALQPIGCQIARLAVGAATRKPMRLASAEALLIGHKLDEATINEAAAAAAASIDPIDDVRASATYRRQMCRVLVRRALEQLRQ
ncbi:MAG: FAD binding domain-containing protein [Acidobacteriota bacterium]|nr:FAD binding domain-containing protein [Blastocatellia bacterium]MDW8239775.1 FAD binding domain-containing protein [Acidobacteriota bacterium]